MIRVSTKFNNTLLAQLGQAHMFKGFVKSQQDEIDRDLRKLGVVMYDFWLPETHTLPFIIHPNEKIKGIVYGRYKHNGTDPAQGRGALIATNQRVLLIDKKPLFLKCDELTYGVVSGATYSKVGLAGMITLHTRAGDIKVRTLNQKCAETFLEAIEAKCFTENSPMTAW